MCIIYFLGNDVYINNLCFMFSFEFLMDRRFISIYFLIVFGIFLCFLKYEFLWEERFYIYKLI